MTSRLWTVAFPGHSHKVRPGTLSVRATRTQPAASYLPVAVCRQDLNHDGLANVCRILWSLPWGFQPVENGVASRKHTVRRRKFTTKGRSRPCLAREARL